MMMMLMMMIMMMIDYDADDVDDVYDVHKPSDANGLIHSCSGRIIRITLFILYIPCVSK